MLPSTDTTEFFLEHFAYPIPEPVAQDKVETETSRCSRPQLAWQMYEQLLRIAADRHRQQQALFMEQQQLQLQQQQQHLEPQTIDSRQVWLAAFTGCNISYRTGVTAGSAQHL